MLWALHDIHLALDAILATLLAGPLADIAATLPTLAQLSLTPALAAALQHKLGPDWRTQHPAPLPAAAALLGRLTTLGAGPPVLLLPYLAVRCDPAAATTLLTALAPSPEDVPALPDVGLAKAARWQLKLALIELLQVDGAGAGLAAEWQAARCCTAALLCELAGWTDHGIAPPALLDDSGLSVCLRPCFAFLPAPVTRTSHSPTLGAETPRCPFPFIILHSPASAVLWHPWKTAMLVLAVALSTLCLGS